MCEPVSGMKIVIFLKYRMELENHRKNHHQNDIKRLFKKHNNVRKNLIFFIDKRIVRHFNKLNNTNKETKKKILVRNGGKTPPTIKNF